MISITVDETIKEQIEKSIQTTECLASHYHLPPYVIQEIRRASCQRTPIITAVTSEEKRKSRKTWKVGCVKKTATKPKADPAQFCLQRYGLTISEIQWLATCPVRLKVLAEWFNLNLYVFSRYRIAPKRTKRKSRQDGKPKFSVALGKKLYELYELQQNRLKSSVVTNGIE